MQAEEAAAAAAAADGAADGEGEGDEEVTGAQTKTRKVGRLVSELPVCTDTIARRAAEKRRHMVRPVMRAPHTAPCVLLGACGPQHEGIGSLLRRKSRKWHAAACQ